MKNLLLGYSSTWTRRRTDCMKWRKSGSKCPRERIDFLALLSSVKSTIYSISFCCTRWRSRGSSRVWLGSERRIQRDVDTRGFHIAVRIVGRKRRSTCSCSGKNAIRIYSVLRATRISRFIRCGVRTRSRWIRKCGVISRTQRNHFSLSLSRSWRQWRSWRSRIVQILLRWIRLLHNLNLLFLLTSNTFLIKSNYLLIDWLIYLFWFYLLFCFNLFALVFPLFVCLFIYWASYFFI